MLKRLFQDLYFRIAVSKYADSLLSLGRLYVGGDEAGYLQQMELLYAGLLQLPLQDPPNGASRRPDSELVNAYAGLPDHPFYAVYTAHTNWLLHVGELIRNGDAKGVHGLSGEMELFLNKLYAATAVPKDFLKRTRRLVAVGAGLAFLLVVVLLYRPVRDWYYEEKDEYNVTAHKEAFRKKTLQDILVLKDALQRYYNDHHSYPKSSGGWDAVLALWGESRKDWIPGLVPAYLQELPADPRKSKEPRRQYMYKSDGVDYKLMAHQAIGMDSVIKLYPELVDPARPTWAFGAWTEGAKNW